MAADFDTYEIRLPHTGDYPSFPQRLAIRVVYGGTAITICRIYGNEVHSLEPFDIRDLGAFINALEKVRTALQQPSSETAGKDSL